MENLLKVTFIGLVSGIIGTGTGGLTAFFIKNITNRVLSFILEFSAGLMTAVVFFKLLPEAFELGGNQFTFAGVFLGIFAILIMDNLLRKASFLNRRYGKNSLLRAGILTALGIALHNLPEGFAVGSGFESSTSLGVALTIVIAIHDIPEGIAMSLPMRFGGLSRTKAFVLTVLSGVPMGVGAFIGALLGGISKAMIAICLGFAGGAMLYIVYGELITEAKRLYLGRLSSIGNVLGIICGIIISVYN